ncbi:hypothetical protein CHS0354_000006, partial [Potamilus streckersoni]
AFRPPPSSFLLGMIVGQALSYYESFLKQHEATRKKLNASELDKEIKEMFQMFDKNGDKTLSVDELGKAMRSLGFNMTQAEVRQAMVKIDTN